MICTRTVLLERHLSLNLTRFTNTYYTFKYVARAARQWSAVRHQNAIQILEQSGSRIKITPSVIS